MKSILTCIICVFSLIGFAQDQKFNSEDLSITNLIDGTLLTPLNADNPNLVILIGGSGPTDRNGNQNFLKNNSLKKLAEQLAIHNIASFRFDKRIVKQIKMRNIDKTILFDDFVSDAQAVLDYFKSKNAYKHIIVIGHSQGSLIGMLIAKDKADGYISVAGPAQTIDNIIIDQISVNAPNYIEDSKKVFAKLKVGETTTDYPAALESIFNIDMQPFFANWMSYNPEEELKTLNMPILIVNGTEDLQVSVTEAERLKTAVPLAQLVIIDKMNHVLVPIESGDPLENTKSYNESARPLSPELINTIVDFIQKI
ncbi:alpha/beta hydrolase [Formosa haliotis]|uniref:alpha/beta hydrolase n=1 Tax=Formosa haliotis TaxID=1555194 RepID=UPI000825BFFA|nr:alpha/beta hydrolase [Formosa haliotis]